MDANGLPDAVRGLYISSAFPNGEQNRSGWADWSGTSFSTAIISALGAHLMSQSWSAANAMTRIAAGRERRTDKLFGPGPGCAGTAGECHSRTTAIWVGLTLHFV